MDGLMTIDEAARFLRLHQVTIRCYIKSGRLRAVGVGGRIRMRREYVEEFARPMLPSGRTRAKIEEWKPFNEDDPLFSLIGIGQSEIEGGISSDKYRQFPVALGAKD